MTDKVCSNVARNQNLGSWSRNIKDHIGSVLCTLVLIRWDNDPAVKRLADYPSPISPDRSFGHDSHCSRAIQSFTSK